MTTRLLPALLLAGVLAAGFTGCRPPTEPLDADAFGDLLRENGLDEPYAGAEKSGQFWTELMWRSALLDDARRVETQTVYRRGEPLWETAGWDRLVAGIDSSLGARHWDTPGADEAARRETSPDYVRVWTGRDQRLVFGRTAAPADSAGYFVPVILTGPAR